MPQGGELEIVVSTASPGGQVCVEVRDTGCGILPENLEKIFLPLFSTKTKGIGLGLAISRRYAELNGGHLAVESTVGTGTSFRLTLNRAS
jgi:signal transduction histidine kinase